MEDIDRQESYWDGVADQKTFSHPIPLDAFRTFVSEGDAILDYGCGYGRSCAFLRENGYTDVVGVDISNAMLNRGNRMHDGLRLRRMEGRRLPFADETFAACTLLAVLTCVPGDEGQRGIVDEIHRVLKPGGILYLSDYPLQRDRRNQERYSRFEHEFNTFGIFRLSDGGIVRHHDMPWIHTLLAAFDISREGTCDILTMNGNSAKIFQIIARKR